MENGKEKRLPYDHSYPLKSPIGSQPDGTIFCYTLPESNLAAGVDELTPPELVSITKRGTSKLETSPVAGWTFDLDGISVKGEIIV